MKILVIEDDRNAALMLEMILTDEGHDVRTAGRAREAIATAGEFHPDLIVSDWKLEDELDGIDVCQRIVAKMPQAKVIMMSGCPFEHLERAAHDLHPFRMFTKPINIDEVVATAAAC